MESSARFTDLFMEFIGQGHWLQLYLLSCAWSFLVVTFFVVGARMMATSHPQESVWIKWVYPACLIVCPGINFLIPAAGILTMAVVYIRAFYTWWYWLYLITAVLFFSSFYYFY